VTAVTIQQGLDRIFIIARYDRGRNPEGHLVRLYRKDFCQSLGYPPGRRYQSERYP